MEFVEAQVVLPAESVGVLLTLEAQKFQLVVLLLLALCKRLLLVGGLLQVLVLVKVLLVAETVGLGGKLAALLLELADLGA